MNCNCTDSLRGQWRNPHGSGLAPHPRRRRATAEVELILVIPVLLTVLLLCGIAAKLGHARIGNARDAEQLAYHQVQRGENVAESANLTPEDSVAAVRRGLPTRFDEAMPLSTPKLTEGWLDLKGVTLADKAVFLDSTWHIAAWPLTASDTLDSNPGDVDDVKQWFVDQIEEAHPWELRYGLGLAEPWKP